MHIVHSDFAITVLGMTPPTLSPIFKPSYFFSFNKIQRRGVAPTTDCVKARENRDKAATKENKNIGTAVCLLRGAVNNALN